MRNIIKEMHEPCLFKCGFKPIDCIDKYNKEGLCYSLHPERGDGFYWVYAKDNLFSISIEDYIFYDDLFLEFNQPTFIGVNYYDSVSKKELQPYKEFNERCLRCHISNNTLYRAICYKNIPVHSVSIEIMPELYENYLNMKYPGEFKNIKFAFSLINNCNNFTELILLLKQIRNFHGTGATAEIYYESKVFEALSLIIENSKNNSSLNKTNLLSQDLYLLSLVHNYINDNYMNDLNLDTLSEIALMGKTKLKYAFKQAYNCTLTQYIQNVRINKAKFFLLNSSLTVRETAMAVGYSHVGYFSKLFYNKTGLSPVEYRKLTKKII